MSLRHNPYLEDALGDRELITCAGGVFTLPEKSYGVLQAGAATGVVWLRQDEDTFLISPVEIAGGRRKSLSRQFRAQMFLKATRVVVVDDSETVRLMAAQWRPARRRTAPETEATT